MKRFALVAAVAASLMGAPTISPAEEAAASAAQAAAPKMETIEQKGSYVIGFRFASDMKQRGVNLDPELFAAGIRAAQSEGAPALTEEEMMTVLQELEQSIMAREQAKAEVAKGENQAEADKFLEENKAKDGVKVTESGLQYKVITEGAGDSPKENSTVKVHYRGRLIDGTEFDSSYGRGEPATFPVNGVIKGWTEALQLMKPGAKWELYIPPALAYGERGAGAKIGPNALLIFEVELLEVVQ